MSTPVGQSVLHARQERHRSRASWTSGERQPSSASDPAAISWSSLARPRVEWRSSPVARYDGHMSAWPCVETQRPTPMQRSTAARKSPPSASNARPGVNGASVVGRGRRRSTANGSGSTMIPGLSRPALSQIAFHSPNAASIAGLNWRASSSLRARPSPCSPLSVPPCATTRSAARSMNARKRASPPGASSPKPTRRWMQPSPKWPYVTPRRSASRSRSWSAARYAARRSGGTAASSNPGQAGEPSGSRDARPAPSSRTRHRVACARESSMSDAARERRLRPAVRASRVAWSRIAVASSPPASTSSHAPPGGRSPGSVHPERTLDGQALDGERLLGEERRHGSRGLDVVAEREHQQPRRGGRCDEPQRRRGDHGAGALGARERPGDVEAALGEQPVEAVARDASGPRRQLGAQQVGVAAEERPQPVVERRPQGVGAASCPVRRDELEPEDVLRRRPPPDRVRPAGVVAHHPADRAPRVRGRVRPDAQPVACRRRIDRVEDRARQDRHGPRLDVERRDPVEVACRVDDDPRADGVAGDARPAAAHRERDACRRGQVDHGRQVVDRRRCHDRRGQHPVVRRVGRVHRERPRVGRHVPAQVRPQPVDHVGEGVRGRPCGGRIGREDDRTALQVAQDGSR